MVVLFSPDLSNTRENQEEKIKHLKYFRAADFNWGGFYDDMRDCGIVPGPVGFEEGRIVDDGGQQGGEGPQEQRGEKLGDDRVLDRETHTDT